ncbi:hypothetical protein [Bradyrhizobium sp. 137]|uniref:hypothetical protein n=1 Tax=Bradyrhizobium sp. 137 TaxID=2782614 RepID=UPI001FF83E35|nr:hypothetical protein [Bradyrhizobium sp. 137]
MDRDRDKRILQERLERCRKLSRDFPSGPTAEHIRELEAELLDDLRALERSDVGTWVGKPCCPSRTLRLSKATYAIPLSVVEEWTVEEHEQLKAMAEAGRQPDEIAKELNRSEAAVRIRSWQHGIALRLVTSKRGK